MATMTTLPLLRGDYLNGEEPTEWMQQFQLSLPPTWTDTEKIDRFKLQCVRGGPAHLWVTSLPAAQTATWAILLVAFDLRWPTAPPIHLTAAQKKERLKAIVLKETDIGVMMDNEKGQEWGHLSDLYPDWGAFVTGVNNVSINSLNRARAKASEEREMKKKIEQLKAKLTDSTAPLTRQFASMSMPSAPPPLYRPRAPAQVQSTQQQIYQQPLQQTFQPAPSRPAFPQQPSMSVPPSHAPLPAQAPSQPFTPSNLFAAAGAVPRTNLFYRYQPQTPSPNRINIAECLRIAAQYAGMPHQPDTEAGRAAHTQQVKEWHEKHSADAMPHTGRPYPLKPGTAPLGSRECFACGMATVPSHRAVECPNPPLAMHEAKWHEIISGLVGSIMRNANLATPTVPTQPTTPVQFISTVNPYVTQYHAPEAYYGAYQFDYHTAQGYQGNGNGLIDPAVSDLPTSEQELAPELIHLDSAPESIQYETTSEPVSESTSISSLESSEPIDSRIISAIASSVVSEETRAGTPIEELEDGHQEAMTEVVLPFADSLSLPDSTSIITLDTCDLGDSTFEHISLFHPKWSP
ncbi:hypothetical protein C8R48DRAFT_678598 [Suillus tomentosus]|nr:hypothetical protein C8R48DRAFT_678598 [Suillus tomentosus]